MKYEPRGVAQGDLQAVKQFLEEELRTIADVVNAAVDGHLERKYVIEDRPRDGDFRYYASAVVSAAAVEGVYFYQSDTWALWLP